LDVQRHRDLQQRIMVDHLEHVGMPEQSDGLPIGQPNRDLR